MFELVNAENIRLERSLLSQKLKKIQKQLREEDYSLHQEMLIFGPR